MKEVNFIDSKAHFSKLEKVSDVIRELQVLSKEVAHAGVTLKEIQEMKEEGRK